MADLQAGRFREDLFYRLHVFPIAVPPLRERTEDIPELVRHFLARFAAEEGKRIRTVSGVALAILGRYHWPGNVRQLENAVFRAVVLSEGEEVGTDQFPQIEAQVSDYGSDILPPAAGDMPLVPESTPLPTVPLASPAMALPIGATVTLLDAQGEVRPLEEIEAEAIRYAISHYRNQMSQVARKLRIGRSTLYRKLESLGLAAASGAEKAGVAAE